MSEFEGFRKPEERIGTGVYFLLKKRPSSPVKKWTEKQRRAKEHKLKVQIMGFCAKYLEGFLDTVFFQDRLESS